MGAINAAEPSQQLLAIQERDYKEAIRLQKEEISQAPVSEKAALTYSLALLYLKDQDQELAFRTLLDSLDQMPSAQANPQKPYDSQVYKQAFDIYLDPSSPSPQETSKKLLNLLLPYLREHPEQTLLEYYVAIAYANIGKYEDFFSHFRQAYQSYPDHYLAYRTKAVLHIKIMERQRTDKERAEQRQAVVDNLEIALQKEPKDVNIYKMLIAFSAKEKKSETVRQSLNKILDGNIIIPRGDLMFYAQAAVEAGDWPLAKKFVDRSHEWYPQSRIVNTAQKYLEAHKGVHCNE